LRNCQDQRDRDIAKANEHLQRREEKRAQKLNGTERQRQEKVTCGWKSRMEKKKKEREEKERKEQLQRELRERERERGERNTLEFLRSEMIRN
jgi:hypothetical protein